MLINTTKFGEAQIDDEKIIAFDEGLPGMENLKRYVLLSPEDTSPFHWLQALDDPDIALPVLDPSLIMADYSPFFPNEDLEFLHFVNNEDALLFTVAVIPSDLKAMTTNLQAPILINAKSCRGKQIILGNDYELRHPIYDALSEYLSGGGADAGSDSQD